MSPVVKLQSIRAPQTGDTIRENGREVVERVVAYWPDFHAWEVNVLDDRGHRADTRGKPITRMVRNAGFGDWAVVPER